MVSMTIAENLLPSFSQVSHMAAYPAPNETMRLPPASSMVPQISVSQNIHPNANFFISQPSTMSHTATTAVPLPPSVPSTETTQVEQVDNVNTISETVRIKAAPFYMQLANVLFFRYLMKMTLQNTKRKEMLSGLWESKPRHPKDTRE